jgi:hypothetical protein
MSFVSARAIGLGLLAAALSGCKDVTAPEATPPVDVFGAIADVESYAAAGFAAWGAPMLPSLGTISGSCPFDSTIERFVCAPVSNEGLTLARSFQLFTAAGNLQSAYEPTTTRSIRVDMNLTGTIGAGTVSARNVSYHSVQTVGGMDDDTRTLVGTSEAQFAAPGAATLTMNTATNLTIPRAATAGRVYPTGRIRTLAVSSILPTVIEIITDFDGTSTAVRRLIFAGVLTCTINLDQLSAPPTCTS